MDIKNLISQALEMAKTAKAVLPNLPSPMNALSVADRIVGLIDELTNNASSADATKLAKSRDELAKAVRVKADETTARLRGE